MVLFVDKKWILSSIVWSKKKTFFNLLNIEIGICVLLLQHEAINLAQNF